MIVELNAEQQKILLGAYSRGWLIHYWDDVCEAFPEASMNRKKELFFDLLKIMLEQGKARFRSPHGEGDVVWNEKPDKIIEHLLEGWPSSAEADQSDLIISYFYDDWNRCPPVHWLSEDGIWEPS